MYVYYSLFYSITCTCTCVDSITCFTLFYIRLLGYDVVITTYDIIGMEGNAINAVSKPAAMHMYMYLCV